MSGSIDPAVRLLVVAANFIVYFGGYVYSILATYYIISFISLYHTNVTKTGLKIVITGAVILTILTVISLFNGMIFSVDETTTFIHGPFYFLPHTLSLTSLVVCLSIIFRYRTYLGSKDQKLLIFFVSIPSIASVFELLNPYIMVGYFATTISLVVLSFGVQLQQDIRTRERETSLKTLIMLSQIQPHFLINSLLSIKALIRKDPSEAAEAIDDFSYYLRGNMDSLSTDELIPFEREIKHVTAYLDLEKRRFQDKLQIHMDIDLPGIQIPPLTLQPIVENAVKHGVMKRENGGAVTITSEQTTEHCLIIIEDDGVGFDVTDPTLYDNSSHVGIYNTRSRLTTLCKGTLTISSELGKGTRAVISLPLKQMIEK